MGSLALSPGCRCCCPPWCYEFVDCTGPLAGVSVTLTPKDSANPSGSGTSGDDGKVCFSDLPEEAAYTANYKAPSGYTAPDAEDITIPCGATVRKQLYPVPGKFILGPGAKPAAPPGTLTLTTPTGEATLSLNGSYPGQVDGSFNADRVLLTWAGSEDLAAYEITAPDPFGHTVTCRAHDRILYAVGMFGCGRFVLVWERQICIDGLVSSDPPGGTCSPGCEGDPAPLGIGSLTEYQGNAAPFYQYGIGDRCGFAYGSKPVSGHAAQGNTGTAGTVYVDFGAAGHTFGGVQCFDAGRPVPIAPDYCCGMDAVICTTWNLAPKQSADFNWAPVDAQPVAISLVLSA